MRKLYSALTYLIAPLLPLYLRKRGKKNPEYLENWYERFGINLINKSAKPVIWFHSVSVGETRAMHKLVELVHNNLPDYQILITNMTPTGRDTAKSLYHYSIVHYIPYDLSFCVKSFYNTFKPKIGIIMETEIWPNLIHFGAQSNIPLYLVNARLSDRSYRGYNRFKWALMPIINKLSGILCQDSNTASNFTKLSYTGKLEIVGNTKFDLVIPDKIQVIITKFKLMIGNRKVITFASTRDGEEELFINRLDFSTDILYLIVPRHPERFTVVESLLQARQIKYQKRSDNNDILPDTKVLIGDSMGEMLAYYSISYLAVIGGSFTDCGGQNPIEAIFMRVPVIFGYSMYNFAEVAKNCLVDKCGIQVHQVDKLPVVLSDLCKNNDKYQAFMNNCNLFISKYQGASEKIFTEIKNTLTT